MWGIKSSLNMNEHSQFVQSTLSKSLIRWCGTLEFTFHMSIFGSYAYMRFFLHMRIPAKPHTLCGSQWKKLTCMLPLLRQRESRRRREMQKFAMICDDLRWPDFKTWLKDLRNLGSHPVCCARAFNMGTQILYLFLTINESTIFLRVFEVAGNFLIIIGPKSDHTTIDADVAVSGKSSIPEHCHFVHSLIGGGLIDPKLP